LRKIRVCGFYVQRIPHRLFHFFLKYLKRVNLQNIEAFLKDEKIVLHIEEVQDILIEFLQKNVVERMEGSKNKGYNLRFIAEFIFISIEGFFLDTCFTEELELKKKYPSFAEFNKKYQVPQALLDEIVAEGEKQKVKAKDQKELKTSLASIKIQLKALVARDLWDMSEYFQVINEENPIVRKAVELFEQAEIVLTRIVENRELNFAVTLVGVIVDCL